jgi:hypothetical protein
VGSKWSDSNGELEPDDFDPLPMVNVGFDDDDDDDDDDNDDDNMTVMLRWL